MECPPPACMRTTIHGFLELFSILSKAFQFKIMNQVSWEQLSVLLIPPKPFSVISQQSYVVDTRRRHRFMDRHFIGHLPFWQDRNPAYLGIHPNKPRQAIPLTSYCTRLPFLLQACQRQSCSLGTCESLFEPEGGMFGAWHNSNYQLQEWTVCWREAILFLSLATISHRNLLTWTSLACMVRSGPIENPILKRNLVASWGAALFGPLCDCLSCPMTLNWIRHNMTSATLVDHIPSYLE